MMNANTFKVFMCTLLFSLVQFVNAEVMTVEYKGFYSHLTKINKEKFDMLQFSFGFQHIHESRLCSINNAHIHTDKQNITVEVTGENRFILPTERALKLADALVVVDLKDQSNQCDLSVQLETKADYIKSIYSQQVLNKIYLQYSEFFDSMGGWMSWMMPKVESLRVYFDDTELNHKVADSELSIVNGVMNIGPQQLQQIDTLRLPVAPKRITPVTNK